MAIDAFLKLSGIDGESTDDKHKNEIDVLSFSWGSTQPGLAAGDPVSRNAKAKITDFTFIKKIDKATPQLLLSSCGDTRIPSAVLTVRKTGGEGSTEAFLKITMKDLIISSYSAAGDTQDQEFEPHESISLNFSKMELTVISQTGEMVSGVCGPDTF